MSKIRDLGMSDDVLYGYQLESKQWMELPTKCYCQVLKQSKQLLVNKSKVSGNVSKYQQNKQIKTLKKPLSGIVKQHVIGKTSIHINGGFEFAGLNK